MHSTEEKVDILLKILQEKDEKKVHDGHALDCMEVLGIRIAAVSIQAGGDECYLDDAFLFMERGSHIVCATALDRGNVYYGDNSQFYRIVPEGWVHLQESRADKIQKFMAIDMSGLSEADVDELCYAWKENKSTRINSVAEILLPGVGTAKAEEILKQFFELLSVVADKALYHAYTTGTGGYSAKGWFVLRASRDIRDRGFVSSYEWHENYNEAGEACLAELTALGENARESLPMLHREVKRLGKLIRKKRGNKRKKYIQQRDEVHRRIAGYDADAIVSALGIDNFRDLASDSGFYDVHYETSTEENIPPTETYTLAKNKRAIEIEHVALSEKMFD